MTVAELINFLRECEPDARVLLATQPSWPFESSISAVVIREEFEDTQNEGRRASDVLLLEGTQLRYGNRAAWSLSG